jgi:YD repeat-containing protein
VTFGGQRFSTGKERLHVFSHTMIRPFFRLCWLLVFVTACHPAPEPLRPAEAHQRFASMTSTEPTPTGSRSIDEAYWYNGAGHPISYQRRTDTYTSEGLQESRQEQTSYDYNDAGRLVRWESTSSWHDGTEAFQRADVKQCEYVYNAAGLAIEAQYRHRTARPGTVSPWVLTSVHRYTYDAAGTLTAFRIERGTETETYQVRSGRVAGYEGTRLREWNAQGFVQRERDATGETTYTYSTTGNLLRQERTEAGRPVRREEYTYDTYANYERTFPQVPGVPRLPAQYGSNPNNRIRITTTEWPDGGPLQREQRFMFEYSGEGLPIRRTRADHPDSETTFGYVTIP